MSLDVYLTYPQEPTALQKAVAILKANGLSEQADYLDFSMPDDEYQGPVYSRNITHNLGRMAAEAGVYEVVWRPDENGITKARQLIEPLTAGIEKMRNAKDYFETFNASNGWGTYENFLPWLESYLEACQEHPEADVSVSR